MSGMQVVTADRFGNFAGKLQAGQTHYLPMIFGTVKESIKQTKWLETFDDQYVWLIDELEEGNCLFALGKYEQALSITLMLPSDWSNRFTILESSIPNLIGWFVKRNAYQYLWAQMGEDRFPPTLIVSALPTFLKNGFRPEYRMTMKRDGKLPIPAALSLPEGVTREKYLEKNLDEIAFLISDVYAKEGVDYSFSEAKADLIGYAENELFQKSATFLRNGEGELVGGICCGINEHPYIGEFVVSQKYQGRGLGQYLLNESIRLLAKLYPEQAISLSTCREWKRAVNLYEKYDFSPDKFWINLSLNKRPSD